MNSGVVDSREILEFIRNIVEDSSIDDESLEICNRTIDFALKRIDEYGLLKTQLEIAEQTIKLNEWIDVRKQLPKFDEEVLVEMKDGSHCVAKYHTEMFNNKIILYWIYNDFTKYYCDDEKKEKNEVVAWKKVEPYERKE